MSAYEAKCDTGESRANVSLMPPKADIESKSKNPMAPAATSGHRWNLLAFE